MENPSSISFFIVAVRNLCDSTSNFECSFSLLISIGNVLSVQNHHHRDKLQIRNVAYFGCYRKMLTILYWTASFVLDFCTHFSEYLVIIFCPLNISVIKSPYRQEN